MTRTTRTFRALLESLESIGLAAFVEMVAGLTGERCAIAIGNAVIARGTNE